MFDQVYNFLKLYFKQKQVENNPAPKRRHEPKVSQSDKRKFNIAVIRFRHESAADSFSPQCLARSSRLTACLTGASWRRGRRWGSAMRSKQSRARRPAADASSWGVLVRLRGVMVSSVQPVAWRGSRGTTSLAAGPTVATQTNDPNCLLIRPVSDGLHFLSRPRPNQPSRWKREEERR